MSLQYSTALRNFLQLYGSKKQALMNGVFRIYTGSPPSSPDLALTGTLLVQVTLSSGTWTPEVLSYGTVTLSGSGGQVDQITVNGVNMLAAPIAYNTSLSVTAQLVAAAINANHTNPNYMSYSNNEVIYIVALPGTGTLPNGYVVSATVSGGTLGASCGNFANGVNPVNGLTFGGVSSGALEKSGVWSGVVLANGTAGYFVQTGSRADDGTADASPWNKIRLIGTCGTTSGADYNMGNTSMILGRTHTIDSWIETLAED